MQTGAIFIVDADSDDREMIRDIAIEMQLPNKLHFFKTGHELIDYLSEENEPPFIVLSEVNLPKMDGFELRQHLLENGSKKFRSVPFIFWSNRASDAQIQKAYDLSAHGFFLKPNFFTEMEQAFKAILQYWRISRMPSKANATDG